MSRRPGQCSPTDLHRVVKLPPELFVRLGEAAMMYKISRPMLANELLNFMLDNPEIIDTLLFDDNQVDAAE